MAAPGETHFFEVFKEGLTSLAQQMESRFSPHAVRESIEGEQKFFDHYGKVEFIERTERLQENTIQNIDRHRRAISRRDFEFTMAWDPREDTARKHFEPNPELMQAVASAWNRRADSLIFEACGADAKSGRRGQTDVSLPSSQVVGIQIGEEHREEEDSGSGKHLVEDVQVKDTGANQPFNLGKLRNAKRILLNNDVEGELVCFCHPNDLESLYDYQRVVSRDYRMLQNIQDVLDGTRDTILNIRFVTSTEVPKHDTTQRDAFVLRSKRPILFGMDKSSIDVRLDDLPTRGHGRQLAVYADGAATRRFEEEVVKIVNLATDAVTDS